MLIYVTFFLHADVYNDYAAGDPAAGLRRERCWRRSRLRRAASPRLAPSARRGAPLRAPPPQWQSKRGAALPVSTTRASRAGGCRGARRDPRAERVVRRRQVKRRRATLVRCARSGARTRGEGGMTTNAAVSNIYILVLCSKSLLSHDT